MKNLPHTVHAQQATHLLIIIILKFKKSVYKGCNKAMQFGMLLFNFLMKRWENKK